MYDSRISLDISKDVLD